MFTFKINVWYFSLKHAVHNVACLIADNGTISNPSRISSQNKCVNKILKVKPTKTYCPSKKKYPVADQQQAESALKNRADVIFKLCLVRLRKAGNRKMFSCPLKAVCLLYPFPFQYCSPHGILFFPPLSLILFVSPLLFFFSVFKTVVHFINALCFSFPSISSTRCPALYCLLFQVSILSPCLIADLRDLFSSAGSPDTCNAFFVFLLPQPQCSDSALILLSTHK